MNPTDFVERFTLKILYKGVYAVPQEIMSYKEKRSHKILGTCLRLKILVEADHGEKNKNQPETMKQILCMNKIKLRKCVWKKESVCSSRITEIYYQNVTQECVDSVFGNNDLKREREATLFYLHQ